MVVCSVLGFVVLGWFLADSCIMSVLVLWLVVDFLCWSIESIGSSTVVFP